MSKEPTIQELFDKADNYRNNGQVDKAVSAYTYISEIAKEQGDMYSIAKSLHMAGVSLKEEILGEGTKLRDAIEFYKQAERFYSRLNEQVGLGSLYRDCGTALDCAERYDEAEVWLKKSIETLEKTKAADQLGISTVKLGLHYFYTDNYEEAESVIRKGIVILRESPEAGFFNATALLDLSRVLFKLNKFEEAEDTALQSLSWYEADHGKEEYARRKAELNGLLSLIFNKLDDQEKARKYAGEYQKQLEKSDPEAVKVIEKKLEKLA